MSHLLYPDNDMLNWTATPLIRDYFTPRLAHRQSTHHDILTNVTADKHRYQVSMDVHQFLPHEIVVKAVGDLIIVEGKHEEKQDDHGYISRHFVRKYKLPHDHHSDDVVSSLSSDGILCITAPRKNPDAVQGERLVPIHVMGPVRKEIEEERHPHSHRGRHFRKQDHQINVQHI